MISYSAFETPPNIKCWSIKDYDIGDWTECVETRNIPQLNRIYPMIDHFKYIKITVPNKRSKKKKKITVKLKRENQSVLPYDLSILVSGPQIIECGFKRV